MGHCCHKAGCHKSNGVYTWLGVCTNALISKNKHNKNNHNKRTPNKLRCPRTRKNFNQCVIGHPDPRKSGKMDKWRGKFARWRGNWSDSVVAAALHEHCCQHSSKLPWCAAQGCRTTCIDKGAQNMLWCAVQPAKSGCLNTLQALCHSHGWRHVLAQFCNVIFAPLTGAPEAIRKRQILLPDIHLLQAR